MGFLSTPAGQPLIGGVFIKNKVFNPMGYLADKYNSNKAAPHPAPIPVPNKDTTPPTMADAIDTTQQKAKPSKQTSGGTVGDLGPQGLTTPPQTANLTLLGGTK